MTFHCLIVGSRGYTDYAAFKAKCDALLAGKTDIEIVSGGASGTDAMAERYAHDHGYSLQIFPAEWSRYGKRAGYVRNREMNSYISTFTDHGVIAFWDGSSRGTDQASLYRRNSIIRSGLSESIQATGLQSHKFHTCPISIRR